MDKGASTFGQLLVEHRRARDWTQRHLALASGLSVRALRDLEQGRVRAARQTSVEALAEALDLVTLDRARFLAAAKGDAHHGTAHGAPDTATWTLPAPTANWCGREHELEQLQTRSAYSAVLLIVGQAGTGKTALAVTLANRLRPDFPDGCFALNLRGMDEHPVTTGYALDKLLRALGTAPEQVPSGEPEQVALLQALLDGQKVLLLLDNAANEAQVRPLLANAPGCRTLVTCRRTLAELEGARRVSLHTLPDDDAMAMLEAVLGGKRVGAEADAARQLIALCGNLPLALRVVADRLATRPDWSLTHLVSLLSDEHHRLRSHSVRELGLHATFDLSYRALSEQAMRLFRQLSAIPGPDFSAELAGVASGMPALDVADCLDELVEASLLLPGAVPGRFQFHDLIRLFAHERLETEEDAGDLERVVVDYLLDEATKAARLFFPDAVRMNEFAAREDAGLWLNRESANWVNAQRIAARRGWHDQVRLLALGMHWYSDARSQEQPWGEIFSLGTQAAAAQDLAVDEAKLLNFVGWAQRHCLDDKEAAMRSHERALQIADRIGYPAEQTWAHVYLCSALLSLGQEQEAFAHARQAYDATDVLPFWLGGASVRSVYGRALHAVGRDTEAFQVHYAILADAERHRDAVNPEARKMTLIATQRAIGGIHEDRREWDSAAHAYRAARWISREAGLPVIEADIALIEGRAWRLADAIEDARECLTLAVDLSTAATARARRQRALDELARLPD